MKKQLIEMGLLLDVYGPLLTEKQRDLVDFYYNEDLSLGEIAENLGISRQGVRDGLLHAEEALRSYEEKLHFLEKAGILQQNCEMLQACAQEILQLNAKNYFDSRIQARMEQIIALADMMKTEL